MKRIKVLFLDQSIESGGGGRSLFYLLKFIDNDRFHPIAMLPLENGVLSDRIRGERVCDLIQEPLLHYSNRIARTPGKNRDQETRFQRFRSVCLNYYELLLLTIFRLPAVVRSEQVAVLYSNNATMRLVALVVGLLTDVKVVWHMRNVAGTFWYSLLSRIPSVSMVIFISHAQRRLFDVPKGKSTVVYNGIDTREFARDHVEPCLRREFDIPAGSRVLGVVGRLLPKKGYSDFMKAAKIILDSYPSQDWHFVVIGGPLTPKQAEHLEELRRLATNLGIQKKIHFTGFQKDIKPYVSDLDVMVIPSVWEEPFGRTAIEAMALGLPVVAYRVGGLPEVVQHEQSGLLCDMGNQAQLAQAMVEAAQPDRGSAMGRTGRRRVEEQFEIVKTIRDIEELLEQLARSDSNAGIRTNRGDAEKT